MSAISQTDLEVAEMSEEQFKNEKMYMATMKMAKELIEKGTMSTEEYRQMDVVFREKYKPSRSVFLFDADLQALDSRQ